MPEWSSIANLVKEGGSLAVALLALLWGYHERKERMKHQTDKEEMFKQTITMSLQVQSLSERLLKLLGG